MNIRDMEAALDDLGRSQGLRADCQEAAKRASELLRGFRAGLDLPWNTNSKDLHNLALGLPDLNSKLAEMAADILGKKAPAVPTEAQPLTALDPCGK